VVTDRGRRARAVLHHTSRLTGCGVAHSNLPSFRLAVV
jgi:hypothetical protein